LEDPRDAFPKGLTLKKLIIAFMFVCLLLPVSAAQAKPASKYPCEQYHAHLRRHGLPVKVFAPIMWRESRCIPAAVGWNYKAGKSHHNCKLTPANVYRKCSAIRSYDVGLLQINSSWRSLTKSVCKSSDMLILQKPKCNLAVAKILYRDGEGISNWKATSGGNISTKKT
jgi:hypothetical protein